MIKLALEKTGLLLLLSLFLFSCVHEKSEEEKRSAMKYAEITLKHPGSNISEYMFWIEDKDNGVRVEKTIGKINFSAQYKPYEYMAIMELKNAALTEEKIKETAAAYEGLQYFTFKITATDEQKELLKVGVQSEQEYFSRLEYFSFEMQKDFRLIEGKDTLPCGLYHFERVYGLAPYATVVLGFPLKKEEQDSEGKKNYEDKTLGYTDKVFGTGNVYMTIKGENLNQMPELVIN
jgi:hypothetical protein